MSGLRLARETRVGPKVQVGTWNGATHDKGIEQCAEL